MVQYPVPALDKGLDILELLATEPSGVSKTEIARRLGRNLNELFRMLLGLERRGFIHRLEGSDRYMLSLRLFALSHRFPPIKRLHIAAAEAMERLAFETQQSCHLSVYYSGKAHIVAGQDAPADSCYSVRLGVEIPLYGSCSGHILLSFAKSSARERMIAETMIPPSESIRLEIEDYIQGVIGRGYEIMDSRRTLGVIDIGFPVFDYTGSIAAALVVPFLPRIETLVPITAEQIVNATRVASQTISANLGFDQDE